MSFAKNIYAVILAGGSGTRFWPESRHLSPKQLCAISDKHLSMLEVTLARLDGMIPPERRLIVTHQDQLAATRAIAGPRCPRILAEPEAKNTAAALALAALDIESRQESGAEPPIMVSLHADHVIQNLAAFRECLEGAIKLAESDFLTLIGIVPRHPETGYGYMERGDNLGTFANKAAFRVRRFVEKPPLAKAEEYLRQGSYFWNSGLFVWRTGALLTELDVRLPALTGALRPLIKAGQDGFAGLPLDVLGKAYATLPKVPVDTAVLEVADKVAMVEADIGWYDVGSWDSLEACFVADSQRNLAIGDVLHIDCENVTAKTDGPFVACIGIHDLVVVAAKGAILVCPKNRAQDVRQVVERLKEAGRQELL